MHRLIKLVIAITFLLSAGKLFASDRVTEIEGLIRTDVSNYIKLIKPGLNFSVYVKVTPRLNSQTRVNTGESLPFFSSEEDDVQIEPWSDQNTPVFKLYSRIQKAEVEINFSTDVKILNLKDFELNVIRSVGLIPGRDEVKVEFIGQPLIKKDFSTVLFNERNVSITIMSLVILFLGTIMFVTLNRYLSIRTAVSEGSGNKENSPINEPPVPISGINSTGSTVLGGESKVGKLSFSDPTRSTELLRDKLKQILESGTFPNLNDMLILMEMLETNIRGFAFLIYELPVEIQDMIYEKGKTDLWYKGFTEVGELDPEIFHSVDKMLRARNLKSNELFETLLIQCWRMENNLTEFIKRLDKKEAFALLYYLPKNISINVARSVYPGGWGDLLGEEKIPAITSFERLNQLIELSYEFEPKYTKKSLETFMNRQDLMTYLKECKPNEEEDIYKVLGENSELEKLRPPFFTYFYLDRDSRSDIFKQLSLDNWALSIFDAPREFKLKLEEVLSDKEKYLLGIYLSRYNQHGVDFQTINNIRENIGRLTFTYKYNKSLGGASLDDESVEEEDDQNIA